MSSIMITPMNEQHLDAVSVIEADVFSDPWTQTMFVQDLHLDCGLCFVALQDEAVVGYVNAWLVCDECTIHRIACSSKEQRSGIGTQLLWTLLYEAAQRGAKTFFLEVRASNTAAQNFYQKVGFVMVGLRKAYYSDTREDAVLMSKASCAQQQVGSYNA